MKEKDLEKLDVKTVTEALEKIRDRVKKGYYDPYFKDNLPFLAGETTIEEARQIVADFVDCRVIELEDGDF